MFYEEKLIEGLLMCRFDPRGHWVAVQGETADIINAIAAMPVPDRERVLRHFR